MHACIELSCSTWGSRLFRLFWKVLFYLVLLQTNVLDIRWIGWLLNQHLGIEKSFSFSYKKKIMKHPKMYKLFNKKAKAHHTSQLKSVYIRWQKNTKLAVHLFTLAKYHYGERLFFLCHLSCNFVEWSL